MLGSQWGNDIHDKTDVFWLVETFGFKTNQVLNRYIPDPYAYVTLNSYLVLFDTQRWNVFQMLSSDTNIDGSRAGCYLVQY